MAVALGLKSSQESTVRLHIKKLGLADQESAPLAGAPASISTDGEYRQRPRIRPQPLTPRLDISDITAAATGQWESILPTLGIKVPKRGRHGPCPVCDGTDRFHFDDKTGDGGWYCRQCDGKNYGDGLDLVAKVTGKSIKEAAQEVAQVLGLVSGALDDEAIRQRQEQAARRAEQEKAQEQARRKQAASYAAELVSQCQHSPGAPYLVGKGLGDWSAMRLSSPVEVGGIGFAAGDLLVPLHDLTGELVNAQLINAQGEKRYLAGGQKAGAFHRIEGGELVAICEGYATGVSVHLATEATVYCAMDAGNLLAVANLARARHPAARIILAADNDAHTEGNPGKTKAEQAAAKVRGLVALPDEPGDWNDYHQAHGLTETQEAIMSISAPITSQAQDANQKAVAPPTAEVIPMPGGQPRRVTPEDTQMIDKMIASQRAALLIDRLGNVAVNIEAERVYRYSGSLWQPLTDTELRREMATIFTEQGSPFSDKGIASAVSTMKLMIPEMKEPSRDLIGFTNGVYDLSARQFRPHSPTDWLLNHNGIEYGAPQPCESIEANAPHFYKWLCHAAGNDTAKMDRISAALFMVLANRYDWQLFLEVTGEGGSGKSIFARIATLLAGGQRNTGSGSMKALDEARGRAQFVGKRLISLPDQSKYIGDGSGIKAITGGDLVEIDGKYEKQFATVLQAVVLVTNNEPMIITERNGGVSRRRVIFTFDRVVSDTDKDPMLGDKIAAELPVVIRYLLTRFAEPDHARLLLLEQRNSDDALNIKRATDPVIDLCGMLAFLDEPSGLRMGGNTELKREPRRYLYHLYLAFMDYHGLGRPLSVQKFSQAVNTAAKEYGREYKTRKVKGYTQTNTMTTDAVEQFMPCALHVEGD